MAAVTVRWILGKPQGSIPGSRLKRISNVAPDLVPEPIARGWIPRQGGEGGSVLNGAGWLTGARLPRIPSSVFTASPSGCSAMIAYFRIVSIPDSALRNFEWRARVRKASGPRTIAKSRTRLASANCRRACPRMQVSQGRLKLTCGASRPCTPWPSMPGMYLAAPPATSGLPLSAGTVEAYTK